MVVDQSLDQAAKTGYGCGLLPARFHRRAPRIQVWLETLSGVRADQPKGVVSWHSAHIRLANPLPVNPDFWANARGLNDHTDHDLLVRNREPIRVGHGPSFLSCWGIFPKSSPLVHLVLRNRPHLVPLAQPPICPILFVGRNAARFCVHKSVLLCGLRGSTRPSEQGDSWPDPRHGVDRRRRRP